MQTVHLGDQDYVIVPRAEYDRLTALAAAPQLPKPDSAGNLPALEFARASLARDLVRDRVAAGFSQKELAQRAGVRVETLCRIETGKVTPSLSTIKKLDEVLKKSEQTSARSAKPSAKKRR